jgi:hypothetical protein
MLLVGRLPKVPGRDVGGESMISVVVYVFITALSGGGGWMGIL